MKHLTDQWRLQTTALDKTRLGHCYELAYRYATSHHDWTLVHGSIQGGGNPRIGHAFCLSPDETEVYEPASDHVWEKDAFDSFFSPTYDAKFDFEQVMANSIKYRHYGPWGAAENTLHASKTAAKNPPQTLYHFTSTMHLPAILSAGYLKQVESNIDISGAGPQVVWLTETTEGSGNGLGTPGFKDQVRFTIPTAGRSSALRWWPAWSREQGIEEWWYEALHAASGGGNPDNWWVSLSKIPLSQVAKIEVRQGSSWVEVDR